MIDFSTLTEEHLADLSNYIDLFYTDQKSYTEHVWRKMGLQEKSFSLQDLNEKERIVQTCENIYGDLSEVIETVKNTTFKILLGYWGYGYANTFVQCVVENDLENAIFYGDKEDHLFLDFYLYAMENIPDSDNFFE